jgi:cyclic 2,3-diphosphoglycerate synthetase
MERVVALIDGEHYIPVTQSALEVMREKGNYDVVGAVFIGGTEKIGTRGEVAALGLPVIMDEDPVAGIEEGISRFQPDLMMDLSDEPIVGYVERFRFASVILNRGVAYAGADFRFDPPRHLDIMEKPSIAVMGTGKRTGKTAACAYVARVLSGQEGGEGLYDPCIVTMGRGGPPEPELVPGKELNMTPDYLLSLADQGKHAASDHFEDALMTRLTTIGSRRCGGGFAGVVYTSNVDQSAMLANTLPENLVLFEGSGACSLSIKVDAQILIVGAHQPLDYVGGYMGPYRVMRSDLIILTMCEPPMADEEKVREMDACIRAINPEAKVVHTLFRPKPLEDIRGKKVLLAVTAPPKMGPVLAQSLQDNYGCRVVGTSHNLANRPRLREDIAECLDKGEGVEVLLTEVKAAGIDVAARLGKENGLQVVFMDNVLVTVGGDGHLPPLVKDLARKAEDRFVTRKGGDAED